MTRIESPCTQPCTLKVMRASPPLGAMLAWMQPGERALSFNLACGTSHMIESSGGHPLSQGFVAGTRLGSRDVLVTEAREAHTHQTSRASDIIRTRRTQAPARTLTNRRTIPSLQGVRSVWCLIHRQKASWRVRDSWKGSPLSCLQIGTWTCSECNIITTDSQICMCGVCEEQTALLCPEILKS